MSQVCTFLSTKLAGTHFHSQLVIYLPGSDSNLTAYVKKWISVLEADPIEDEAMIKDTLRSLTAGYLAIADCPGVLFSGELAEIYPDAIFICTTRDPERWFKSWVMVMGTAQFMIFIVYLLWPLPTLRYLGSWMRGGRKR